MTQGIHPKVALPAIVQLVLGAALTVVGVVAGDNAVLGVGLALIAASGLTGAVGFAAPGAAVDVKATSNDDQLRDAGALDQVQG